MADTAAGKDIEARAAARRAKADRPPLTVTVTLTGMTVQTLYEQLEKLVKIGWGDAPIDWHTSRSHLGRQITMSLDVDGLGDHHA
jgi:hypothetical protein